MLMNLCFKKTKTTTPKSIFASILISYLFLAGFLILLNLIGYLYSVSSYRKETEIQQTLVLHNNAQDLDNLIQNIYELSGSIAQSQLFLNNASLGSKCTPQELLQVTELQESLYTFINGRTEWNCIDVYYPGSHSIISSARRRFAGEDFFLYPKKFELSEKEFLSLLDTCPDFGCLPPSTDKLPFLFVRKVYDIHHDLIGVLLIHVPKSILYTRLTANSSALSGIGFLSDKEGTLLFSTQHDLLPNQPAPTDGIHQIQNANYMVLTTSSNILGWNYGICIPDALFYNKLRIFKRIISCEMVLCSIAGVLLSLYFSKKTYDPMAAVLGVLQHARQNTSRLDLYNSHTYQALEEALIQLRQDKVSLQIHTNQEKQQNYNRLLSGIFSGHISNPDIIEALFTTSSKPAGYGILTDRDNFLIIVWLPLNIEKTVLNTSPEENVHADPSSNLYYFVLRNVILELFQEFSAVIPAVCHGDTVTLIRLEEDHIPEKVPSVIKQVTRFLLSSFQLETAVSVSLIHNGYEYIAQAYEEAREALSYHHFWQENETNNSTEHLYFYDSFLDIGTDAPPSNTYLEGVKKLMNYLEIADFNAVRTELANLCASAFPRNIRNASGNQFRLSTLLGLLLSFLEAQDNSSQTGSLRTDFLRTFSKERLLSVQSLSEFMTIAEELLTELKRLQEESGSQNAPSWILHAKSYITEHYSDNNLNVSAIAEYLKLSVPHLSRTFKCCTGCGVLEYLHRVRLQQAKQRLNQGKSIQSTAEEVGYLDAKALIRAFKRYEGITPSQYRQLQK